MNIEVYGGNPDPKEEVTEGELELKFPIVLQVLVPYERRFESKEDFDRHMVEDLKTMGYVTQNDDGSLEWDDHDVEAWKENYGDVPFPPKTVLDFLSYTKQDIVEGRYSYDELDFEQSDTDEYQWFIKENQ